MDARTSFSSFPAIMSIASLCLLISAPAAAVEIAFDQRAGETTDLHTCGVQISGSADLHWSNGLGVVGGDFDYTIDGSEWVEFDFDSPQRGVYFQVTTAWGPSPELVGRAIVEAFDAGGASLGIQMIQGLGTKDLTALFGASPISRFVLTTLGDGVRIGYLGYMETGSVELDLRYGGNLDFSRFPEPSVCSVRFTGSDIIYYSDDEAVGEGGMGVVGGASAWMVDQSESMRIEFPYPVDELVLESQLHSLDGDLWYGEAVLFAYDDTGSSLGSMSLQRHSLFGGPVAQTVDVAERLGVGGIVEIEIFSLGDGRRLDRVIYTPEPTFGLGASLLAFTAIARRRTRQAHASV